VLAEDLERPPRPPSVELGGAEAGGGRKDLGVAPRAEELPLGAGPAPAEEGLADPELLLGARQRDAADARVDGGRAAVEELVPRDGGHDVRTRRDTVPDDPAAGEEDHGGEERGHRQQARLRPGSAADGDEREPRGRGEREVQEDRTDEDRGSRQEAREKGRRGPDRPAGDRRAERQERQGEQQGEERLGEEVERAGDRPGVEAEEGRPPGGGSLADEAAHPEEEDERGRRGQERPDRGDRPPLLSEERERRGHQQRVPGGPHDLGFARAVGSRGVRPEVPEGSCGAEVVLRVDVAEGHRVAVVDEGEEREARREGQEDDDERGPSAHAGPPALAPARTP